MYILASWTSVYKTVELLGIYWQFSFPLHFFSCKFHVAVSNFYFLLKCYYTHRISILGICVRSNLYSGKCFFEVVTALVALVFLLCFMGRFKTKLFNRNHDGSILCWVFFLRTVYQGHAASTRIPLPTCCLLQRSNINTVKKLASIN